MAELHPVSRMLPATVARSSFNGVKLEFHGTDTDTDTDTDIGDAPIV